MRSTSFLAFVAAFSVVAAVGCGTNSGGGTGGTGGQAGNVAGSGGAGGATGGQGGHVTGTGGAAGHGGAGGGGGQAGQSGSTDCDPPCTGQTVCVGSGVEGGAVFLPGDGGVCPSGRHLQGNTCVSNLTYSCQPIPSGCNGTVTCACAAGSLCTQQQICTPIGANEITCVTLAP